jgi:trk system potassium uptake protein TrkA
MSVEGHHVSIIDRDATAFRRLAKNFKGKTINGIGFDHEVLIQAGIETADAFASVTSGDNTNVVSALVARDMFRVPRVVTRIADPLRAEIYRSFGIATVSPTVWGANEIKEMLLYPGLTSRYTFGNGEVEMVEIRVGPRLAGSTVAALTGPLQMSVVSVVRLGRAFLPTTGARLEEGDLVYVAVEGVSMAKLSQMVQS